MEPWCGQWSCGGANALSHQNPNPNLNPNLVRKCISTGCSQAGGRSDPINKPNPDLKVLILLYAVQHIT